MLYSIESNSEITHIPHRRDFERWRSHLNDDEYQAIVEELNSRIEGTEIQTSSWIPVQFKLEWHRLPTHF